MDLLRKTGRGSTKLVEAKLGCVRLVSKVYIKSSSGVGLDQVTLCKMNGEVGCSLLWMDKAG